MRNSFAPLLAVLLQVSLVSGQISNWDSESASTPSTGTKTSQAPHQPTQIQPEFRTTDVIPPPELRDWTPSSNQFLLYVNFDGQPTDSLTLPKIDILNDRHESCIFWMEKLGDTLYLFIVPPDYALHDSRHVRNTVDSLGWEFPLVVWAGTQRATYWLSHDGGNVVLEAVQLAAFVSPLQLKDLPADVLTLQLEGKNRNASIIRSLVKQLDGHAELIQLVEGFYRNVWFKVNKTVVQKWKTNETKSGTFLAFRCAEGHRDAASQILQKYRGSDGQTSH
jgi:hypothetical protein